MATLPRILFLPGLLEDAEAFSKLIAGLAGKAACQVADLTRSDTIGALARDALAQAPPGPLLIVGHSMGGYVALEMIRQAPERITGIALICTNARPDTPEGTENRRRLMALADRDFPAVVTTLLPKLMTEAHQRDPVLTGIVSGMATAIGKEAFKRQETAIIGRIDSRPHLAAITCPAVVVAAKDDQLMPVAVLQELADGIPGARLTVIEDCGHMATIERPGKVLAPLTEWLERTTP